MATKETDVEVPMISIPRGVLEATARVMGPESAAAKALADADAHNGETAFFRCGTQILVQKKAAVTSCMN
jgi:hypothetical protein